MKERETVQSNQAFWQLFWEKRRGHCIDYLSSREREREGERENKRERNILSIFWLYRSGHCIDDLSNRERERERLLDLPMKDREGERARLRERETNRQTDRKKKDWRIHTSLLTIIRERENWQIKTILLTIFWECCHCIESLTSRKREGEGLNPHISL